MDQSSSSQHQVLVDAIARRLVARTASKDNADATDDSDLADFAAYLAGELWPVLPESFQSASYDTRSTLPAPEDASLDALGTGFTDTLIAYSLAPDADGAEAFARKVLEDYVADATAPPPVWKNTRTDECEMCGREVPLTYHHLIPRSMHTRVMKKGWHPESALNSVAWICRCALPLCGHFDELTGKIQTLP
jgi:hypothetical protein